LQRFDTRKLVLASILAGLSGVFEIIPGPPFDIPFPLYNRVSWDLTGMPMMISLLFTGPIGAVYTCLVGCSFIFLRGNVYGGIFKVIAELATILAFAAIRKGFIPKSVAAVASRILWYAHVIRGWYSARVSSNEWNSSTNQHHPRTDSLLQIG